ncbi:diguanylate cyclase [Roseateles saccharophilus]|uniref:diguanylate cyclase n=1 Tax=Roseateles saccharophilus TaxID=304 RepID=A0A4R3UYI1_ROSSA|nr:diguanylate cyclase [Roseateles saccharophilus]TCU97406.1 diguanylate cyclase (GGDEF)-like protein [Roseateles saccharophilus]
MHRLLDLWLGIEPAQRLRLRQTSLAMALMGLCAPLLHYAVSVAHDPRGPLLWAWTAASLGGMALVYAAIRSGWSRRFADPSLTSLQIAFAITSGAAGYALAGPMRGAVFPVLTLVLMFGMFQLRARSAYALSLFALTLFGLAMAAMAWLRPAVYVPAVEFGHFLMLACMLPAVAVLTARLSRIRHRLSQQREELARALAQLQAIATRDELTGLPNRRQMQALMDQELLRSRRHGHDFCIALLDLDHFKRVNDLHGHAAGDAVLRAFAQAGQAALRATDVLARWGGEEFIVLMPDTAMPPALAGMQRLRQQVAALRVDVGGGEAVAITVSIGLTGHHPGDTLAQTLQRADQLLYQAKHQGRDRIGTEASADIDGLA